MDTRFSCAVHALIMISESKEPLSSERIGKSVGTNASYIRKLTSLLKRGGILVSKQGVSGFSLACPPEEITFLKIYRAVSESEEFHLFDLHQNPNDECVVGRHIQPVLSSAFSSIENSVERALEEKTLADCILEMKNRIDKENQQ